MNENAQGFDNEEEELTQEANLLQFLSGMGGQTLMHLGLMENPLSGRVAVDLPNARYSIDLLSILEEKTRGNLTEEESTYLTTMLTQLRLSYVAAVEENAGVRIRPADSGTDDEEENE